MNYYAFNLGNQQIRKCYIGGGNQPVKNAAVGNKGMYKDKEDPDPLPYNSYLKFTCVSPGTVSFYRSTSTGYSPILYYSLNNGETWTSWNYSSISLNVGDEIIFKGNNPNGISSYINFSAKNGLFDGSALVNVSGNIMSLLSEDFSIKEIPSVSGYRCFLGLFKKGNGRGISIINAKNLLLPATSLYSYCYYSMFEGNNTLVSAPVLPATTLADNCYYNMFYGCTSLTVAPELPATTLANYCYSYMFSRCTSLTSAPELPVTTLADYCYSGMFSSCTSLTTAHELPATTLTLLCYSSMFRGCTSLTTAPELPATTLASSCYYYMFAECTSLTTAPELPATTLPHNCYGSMFRGCTSLNYIKCLATSNINTDDSTKDWVNGVAANGTFEMSTSASWPTGNNGVPSNWEITYYARDTLILNYTSTDSNIVVPNNTALLPTIVSNTYENGLGKIVFATDLTGIGNGTSGTTGAFSDCTTLLSIIFPASTTSIGQYAFYGCSGLTNISLNEDLTSIGNGAFQACSGLTNISLNEGLRSMGNYAFNNCSALTNISLNEGLTSMGQYAFLNCSNVSIFDIPISVQDIGQGAFKSCPLIKFNKLYSTYTNIINYAAVTSTITYTYNIIFNIDEIPAGYNISSLLLKGSTGASTSKTATYTYNIYTDLAACKDQALALTDQYTIVNVYHIDGSPWT